MKTPHLLLLLVLLVLHTIGTLPISQGATNITTDQSVLLTIKSHITKSNPSHNLSRNWSESTSICKWIGVTCSSRHLRITALDVSMMGLTGNIWPELGNLSFLVSLNMSTNSFHGSVPHDFSRMRRLRFMDLSFNSLSGDIPSWFGLLHSLKFLNLRNKSFGGFILPQLSNMSELETLDLTYNVVEGNIPVEIGNLPNLKNLVLRYNQLSGSFPLALFNISSIEKLDLKGNSFYGNIPESICHGTLHSLERLYFSENQFVGGIPANLSKCSNLRLLSLETNGFSGFIPREIGNLRQLQFLFLGNNNLTGAIPEELGNITTMVELFLPFNNLTGSIPAKIFNISSLKYINLARNNLTGTLPADMCSHLKQLQQLYLNENNIGGQFPTRLYECSELWIVDAPSNRFSGTIPRDIGNATQLQFLYFTGNRLTGVIPQEVGNLHNLVDFSFSGNNFTGSIPTSLLNISTLEVLAVSDNQLTGNIPPDFGRGLPSLELLHLFNNNLSVSQEWSFITSLIHCKHLRDLSIGKNPLNGVLPASIGNLSSLESLYVYNCGLRGTIPEEIGNLSNLLVLSLADNNLTGSFPKTLANLRSLQGLYLQRNKISGAIPRSICALKNLNRLILRQNEIYGAIPDCIGNITTLTNIILDVNMLNSTIPLSLWGIAGLLQLDLFSNFLVGSLPPEIGNLKSVDLIDLSKNHLSGTIPDTIKDLQTLRLLSLADNKLEGSVPESIAEMENLETLDLSQNTLSGSIPVSMEKLRHLTNFNVSFNNLSGEIPNGGPFQNFTEESFMFNKGLCGDVRYQVPPCDNKMDRSDGSQKRKRNIQVIFISLGVSALVLVVTLAYGFARFGRKRSALRISNIGLLDVAPQRFSYYDLLEATDGYNNSSLLGTGSFGSVYKAVLKNGEAVAVKVFNSLSERAFESFKVECQVLRNLRHRNLCKVLGSCSNQDFKALILKYMPSGSLEKWLYSHNLFLDITQRISIMTDVACALEYLHHGYSTPIVHCDLKPSNVLLDEHMVAHLCDFGIAKLLADTENSIRTMTLATFGYIAPEFGLEGRMSNRCDVYSYGIMLIEVFTRMKPGDESFAGELSLRKWVNDSMPNAICDIIDANLLRPADEHLGRKVDCLNSVMELALNCSLESPQERLSMKEVVASLKKIKDQLLAH